MTQDVPGKIQSGDKASTIYLSKPLKAFESVFRDTPPPEII